MLYIERPTLRTRVQARQAYWRLLLEGGAISVSDLAAALQPVRHQRGSKLTLERKEKTKRHPQQHRFSLRPVERKFQFQATLARHHPRCRQSVDRLPHP